MNVVPPRLLFHDIDPVEATLDEIGERDAAIRVNVPGLDLAAETNVLYTMSRGYQWLTD
jgi:hypothetical protein